METLWNDVREIVHEQRQYRDLLFQMTKRDLLLRYKQTFMGASWAVFMPLVNTLIFTFIFTRVARVSVGMPYPVFAYSGLVVWNLFATSLRFSITSLTSNIPLVTKVYFPREILPVSSILVCLVDFAIANGVLLLMMVYFGMTPPAAILYLPAVLFVHVTFTTGMALLIAMANLFYRDVKYLFEVTLAAWMFATSVLYPISLIGGRAAKVLQFNPMTPIVDGYRAVMVTGQSPFTAPFAIAAMVSVAVFVTGWVVFHRSEYSFAERV